MAYPYSHQPLTVREFYKQWQRKIKHIRSNRLIFAFDGGEKKPKPDDWNSLYFTCWGWITDVIPPEMSEPEGEEPYGVKQAFSNKLTFVCSKEADYVDDTSSKALTVSMLDNWLARNARQYGDCELWCKKNFNDSLYSDIDKKHGYKKMPNLTVPVLVVNLDPQTKSITLSDDERMLKEANDGSDTDLKNLDKDASFDDIKKTVSDDSLEFFCKQMEFLLQSGDIKAKALYDAFKKGWKEEFRTLDVNTTQVSIQNLHPTQNVIFAKKSLAPILNGKWKIDGYEYAVDALLGSESPELEMGDPIVVCNVGGTDYLIDGHHRWSKAYAFNPMAKMKAHVIKNPGIFKNADDVLKFAQGTLTALRNKSPINAVQPANDYNLYAITPTEFGSVVQDSLSEDVLKRITQEEETKGIVNDIQTLCSYLWGNVRTMKQKAPFGEHDREYMPQFPDKDTNPKNAVAKINTTNTTEEK